MPPLAAHRTLSSALPTLLSLSKLIHLVPSLGSRSAHRLLIGDTSNAAFLADARIEPEDPPDSPIFWWKLGLSVCLVLSGGVFAGWVIKFVLRNSQLMISRPPYFSVLSIIVKNISLTLALMGSDDMNLRVLSTSSDDPKERKAATKVLKLLQRGRHWVLVVLLLGNVIVNESLPIFLNDVLGGGVAAVIVSTTMIVIFGEIIPQAVCVRFGLAIGGACAPLVLGLMFLFAPIAWPTAKLLDRVLGQDEGHTYKKAELKSFLQFHREGSEPLRDDEIGILNGVLSLNEKRAKDIMTPIKDCLTLPADKIMDHEAIDQILLSGFSRIPIYEPGQTHNFIGMLLVKRLITYNPDDEHPVSKFPLLPLPEARPDINCFQALDYFQTGRAHLLLISDTPGHKVGALGIVSLEDLIEEIIGEEIIDETDRFQDNRSYKAAKRSGPAAVMRGIIERQRVGKALSRRPSQANTTQGEIQLDRPEGAGDGLLIQIEDNSMVAEAVKVSGWTADELTSGDGRKLVIGSGAVGMMDSIEEDGGDGAVKEDGSDTTIKEDGGEVTPKEDGKKDDDKDLMGYEEDSLGLPTHESFESATHEFVRKYADRRVEDGRIGPERTNVGWEWREHRSVAHHGYLYRQSTRLVSSASQDEGGEEAEAQQQLPEEDDELVPGENRSKMTRIEVEHHIVYSRTYHVPMLCLRAWDDCGAPLLLSTLLSTGILRGDHPVSGGSRDNALLMDSNSPFPLLQQTEHPTTGDVVWSVHPCQVSAAVDEVLRAEGIRGTERGNEREGLRWLEAWMMRSDEVVDLSYP